MVLIFFQVAICQSSQKLESLEQPTQNESSSQNLRKIQDWMEKLKTSQTNPKPEDESLKENHPEDIVKNLKRKSKGLTFYPFFLPHLLPLGPPPPSGYFQPPNKDGENSFPAEWLSRTEPFKKNTPLLDSPTYYIRLPPNPYAFVPGVGYVSRPPSLSDPEVFENNKTPESTSQAGNDILHDPFYRIPINFVSNGKPTSVYQLSNDQVGPKPESDFVHLNKGPYVFNGKPNEIFLVAQIYNALYGDELNHFYP